MEAAVAASAPRSQDLRHGLRRRGLLVQACRYLSERLLEAWEDAETTSGRSRRSALWRGLDRGPEVLIPARSTTAIEARRLVAQRCLYGVDKNPLAVEMAKLSLWLLTLSKDKPFVFLDHCLRSGDSLGGPQQP